MKSEFRKPFMVATGGVSKGGVKRDAETARASGRTFGRQGQIHAGGGRVLSKNPTVGNPVLGLTQMVR